MSYIKLTIGGQERGIKFNQLAYITFYEKVDMTNWVGTFHYAAVWAGLKANAYIKGEEFTDDFETVCDWVDQMSNDDKEAVMQLFMSTEAYKRLVEAGKEEKPAPKKKTLKDTTQTV